jgi:tRNA uridine 5-carboxymethylaminomethyl modification enzyme
VVKFADKSRHHVFVEPEGRDHPWLYLNGISTSLPPDVQDGVVHSLPGFENATIARYGYAVEYDFVNPVQLSPSLQVRGVEGLFLAGQINGTSGYEEAAAQGLIAGINALQMLRDEPPLVLRRDHAYTAVMIDDLVTLGTEEPYRMFTSRAEYRLLLGCDSVYERLSPIASGLRILDEERVRRIEARTARIQAARSELDRTTLTPDRETTKWLSQQGVALSSQMTLARLIQRPEFDFDRFLEQSDVDGRDERLVEAFAELSEEEREGLVNQTRYAGYIERQSRQASKVLQDESLQIPPAFAFERPGLSREVVEKLNRVRPVSLGQAARIQGVTPAAVAILRMHLTRRRAA